MSLRWVDGGIVLLYLGGMLVLTHAVSGRQRSKEQFMMAGRSMHWLPLALASVAAGFSSISLLGVPGYVMAEDLRYLPTLFMGFAGIPIVYWLLVPFLYRLKLVSIYEWLGVRFCPALRNVASALFMLSKVGYLAISIYTPSLALSAVTGWRVEVFVCILGVLTTAYTMRGGMSAVIWTDVAQYFVIVAGIAGAVFFFAFLSGGDLGSYWRLASVAGKTRTFDWSLGLGNLSMWAIFLNCTLLGTAGMCSNQDAVQRLCTAKSMKDSMRGYLYSILFAVPIVLVLYFIGIWLYGYFHSQAALPEAVSATPDQVFPYFVMKHLPVGVAGLMLAGILAAAMSTISATLHSLSSVFMVDVYERLVKGGAQDGRYVRWGRMVTGAWGVLAMLLAFFVMHLGNTIMEVSVTVGSLTGATLGGLFVLGIFSRRVNSPGAVAGCVAGLACTIVPWYLNKSGICRINFMWYGVFGLVATCLVGYAASFLFPAPSAAQLGQGEAGEAGKTE